MGVEVGGEIRDCSDSIEHASVGGSEECCDETGVTTAKSARARQRAEPTGD